jgi:hypothetical protein
MRRFSIRAYTTAIAGFFMVLGAFALLARLVPAVDRAFPYVLGLTQMTIPHSLLHAGTGVVALTVLHFSSNRGAWLFTAGFSAFYTVLAVIGWSTHPTQPEVLVLQHFDHWFHFTLGLLGVVVAALTYQRDFKEGANAQ